MDFVCNLIIVAVLTTSVYFATRRCKEKQPVDLTPEQKELAEDFKRMIKRLDQHRRYKKISKANGQGEKK